MSFGAALGGNVDAPRGELVLAGLLLEIHLIVRAIAWLVARTSATLQRGQGRGSE